MKSLFKTIQNSIYSPSFYASIPKKSFKQSIRYFLILILLLSAIHLITLINPSLIETPRQLQGFVQNVINCYPKDLEIKITNGQASTNSDEPYFISNCPTLARNQNLVVIDTQTPFSSTKFDEYKVAIWLTKDAVVYRKNKYETSSSSLIRVKDLKLNKAVLNSYRDMLSPWLKLIGPALLLLVFVGIYLGYIFRLIYLFFIALIIWGFGKVFKKPLTYGQAYKVGLYAITLGLIVELPVSLTSRWSQFYEFPFIVTILTLGVVWMNLLWPKKLIK